MMSILTSCIVIQSFDFFAGTSGVEFTFSLGRFLAELILKEQLVISNPFIRLKVWLKTSENKLFISIDEVRH